MGTILAKVDSNKCQTDGKIVNGECVNNIQYADDTIILTNIEERTQRHLNAIIRTDEKCEINCYQGEKVANGKVMEELKNYTFER